MHDDAVAIVPAGGSARRLGTLAASGKAALVAGGETFLDRVCTVLAAEVSRVIVVAAPTGSLPTVAVPVDVIHDRHPGAGPLAAVRDGLAHAARSTPPPRLAVLCACDLPLVAPSVVRLLLDRAAASGVRWVLPVVGDHAQPLLSVLAIDVLPTLERLLAAGSRSLRDLATELGRADPDGLRHVGPGELSKAGVDPASFVDVDTPADLALVRARATDWHAGD